MTCLRITLTSLVLASLLLSPSYADPAKINLLRHADTTLDKSLSSGIDFNLEAKLRDGDEKSSAELKLNTNKTVELMYSFDGKTVSPSRLSIQAKAKRDTAKIEILASTISADAGFISLRTEPIQERLGRQYIDFEQTAAKWIIIKITSFEKETSLSIAEIDLVGHLGTPVSVYEFNESPADAISLLSSLEGSLDLAITDDEASLFKDAADGSLDDWSFAEASLLSSGVYDSALRKKMLGIIDTMEAEMQKSVSQTGDSFEKGQALLTWLHKNSLDKGYVEKQTDVSQILETSTYNCVSSATLYNILGRRLGLDIRGIEVPDHAFSILYDGTKHADVETTTSGGFNPARNKAGLTEFAKKTGFNYISDKNRSKRREVGDAGMVALTYYNHGVGYSKSGEYQKALLNFFRALSLDPKSKSSVKGALNSLSNWGVSLVKNDQLDQALKVLEMGLNLAPKDRGLRNNLKAVWQQKVSKDISAENADLALVSLREAFEKTQDKSFLRMQSWVFQFKAEKQTKQDQWEAALETVELGLSQVDDEAKAELKRYRENIILQWSSQSIRDKDWTGAVDILERGVAFSGSNNKIKNNLVYAIQEWVAQVSKAEGTEASKVLAISQAKRFPDLRNIQRIVSRSFDKEAATARKAGNFEEAVALYAKAREQRPEDSTLRRNAQTTWDMWAQVSMKAKDWSRAIDIYEQALQAEPKAIQFGQNIAYSVQEWSRQVERSDGMIAAENLVASVSERFPNQTRVTRMRGQIMRSLITDLVSIGKFEKAESKLQEAATYITNQLDFDNLTLRVYHNWAKQFSSKRDWQGAIDIYAKGYKAYPKNSKLKRNFIATWHQMADVHMKAKEWQKAINVYERGLVALPNTLLFTKNIKYCKSKL